MLYLLLPNTAKVVRYWAQFTSKVKSSITSFNFISSQVARILLAGFVSKLIFIFFYFL